ncbi:MAG: hypothetical protein JWL88_372 [Parcubacteria group bacterium]|nr:hypothetical protein [Parcubacteria group bacterium]
MDDQHLWLRIRFNAPTVLELRHAYGDRKKERFTEIPAYARFSKEWIIIPAVSSRGLPAEKWEELWDDLKCEIDVMLRTSSTWKPVKDWKTIDRLMKWEERHAGERLQKAAE